MQKKRTILFIGTFLSSQKGTQPIAEHIRHQLQNEYPIRIVSRKKNKLIRLLDILFMLVWCRPSKIVIDVFSGQALWIARIAATIAYWITGTKIILNLRGGKLAEYYQTHAAQISSVFKKADTIITPSSFLRSFFEQHGFKMQVVRNFVNLKLFEFNREHVNPMTLLWVRSFNTTYNPHIAVQVLAALHQRGHQYSLTMIGPDDGLLASTQQLAKQLNVLSHIHFTGPVPQHSLPQYYQTHSIYLNTPSYESFGNALLEAASCGIPLITNSVGEIPYMWKHLKDCMLIHNNDINEFVEAILQLEIQPEIAKSLSEQARINANQYTWEHVSGQWKMLLN